MVMIFIPSYPISSEAFLSSLIAEPLRIAVHTVYHAYRQQSPQSSVQNMILRTSLETKAYRNGEPYGGHRSFFVSTVFALCIVTCDFGSE